VTESPRATARLDGLDVAYVDEGAGAPAVVLVHGLGTSAEVWRLVRPELARHARVVSVDLRGAGRTVERVRAELTLPRWAADLRELAEVLQLGRAVVAGHSLGASVALEWALERPDDVAGLALLGADANLSSLAPRMIANADAIDELGLPRWVDERWVHNPPFSAASLQRSPELLGFYRELVLANDAREYARVCRAIAAAEDLTGRLRELRQPAVVLAGAEDDRTLPDAGRELARAIPDARLVELPGIGHTIPLESPRETVEAILDLL
jgi:pimeloyl-ACP methyl ester carboxylesterase